MFNWNLFAEFESSFSFFFGDAMKKRRMKEENRRIRRRRRTENGKWRRAYHSPSKVEHGIIIILFCLLFLNAWNEIAVCLHFQGKWGNHALMWVSGEKSLCFRFIFGRHGNKAYIISFGWNSLSSDEFYYFSVTMSWRKSSKHTSFFWNYFSWAPIDASECDFIYEITFCISLLYYFCQ